MRQFENPIMKNVIRPIFRAVLRRNRKKRMRYFRDNYIIDKNTRICDVGGTAYNWQFIPEKPAITVINIVIEEKKHDNITFLKGDGTNLPFDDNSFDIAFSNSVIEHLGNYGSQKKFAEEIRRIAPKIFVQTPAKEFFFEPHYLTPFIHWVPKKLRRKIARNFTLIGLFGGPSQETIDKHYIDELRLLTYKEFRDLFPDCKIKKEKFLLFTKAYYAIRK